MKRRFINRRPLASTLELVMPRNKSRSIQFIIPQCRANNLLFLSKPMCTLYIHRNARVVTFWKFNFEAKISRGLLIKLRLKFVFF